MHYERQHESTEREKMHYGEGIEDFEDLDLEGLTDEQSALLRDLYSEDVHSGHLERKSLMACTHAEIVDWIFTKPIRVRPEMKKEVMGLAAALYEKL